MHTNSSMQRDYILKEEATSPIAATDSILTTGTIKVKEELEMIILDVPNAFIQIKIPEGGKKQIIKFRGTIVDILLIICLEVCNKFITESKNGSKILYIIAK